MRQLVPAAEQLSPTLVAFGKLAPEAKGFFEGFGPVIAKSTSGFPAFRKLLRDDFPPFLRAVDPFLRNLNPILTGLDEYKHELTAAMANVAAATQAITPVESGAGIHYLRAMGPFNPESLATFANRLSINRTNAYTQPLTYKDLAAGLPSFDTRGCIGPDRDAQPEHAQRTGLQRARRKRRRGQKGDRILRTAEEIRLRRPGKLGQHRRRPAAPSRRPFAPIYGSGPLDDLPAHLRTGRIGVLRRSFPSP